MSITCTICVASLGHRATDEQKITHAFRCEEKSCLQPQQQTTLAPVPFGGAVHQHAARCPKTQKSSTGAPRANCKTNANDRNRSRALTGRGGMWLEGHSRPGCLQGSRNSTRDRQGNSRDGQPIMATRRSSIHTCGAAATTACSPAYLPLDVSRRQPVSQPTQTRPPSQPPQSPHPRPHRQRSTAPPAARGHHNLRTAVRPASWSIVSGIHS